MPVSRIAQRTQDIISAQDPNCQDPRLVVEEVEQRLILQSRGKRTNCRVKAFGMHQEADRIYLRGDYESSLVLYHRAARLCPSNAEHLEAARRAELSIARSSEANLTGRLNLQRHQRVNPENCPEIVSRKVKEILSKTKNPHEDVSNVLE